MTRADRFGNAVRDCARNDCDEVFGVHRTTCPSCGSGVSRPLRSWDERQADARAAIEAGETDPEALTNPPARPR